MSRILRRTAAVATGVLALAVPAAASATGLPAPFHRGVWDRPLLSGAPLASNSANVVNQIATAVATSGGAFNIRSFSPRIYTVPVTQPRVPIVIDGTAGYTQVLNAAMNQGGGVPFPSGALPSSQPVGTRPDTDSVLVIYQPAWNDGTGHGTGREWEFWHISSPAMNAPGAGKLPWGAPSHGDSKWHAEWGGRLSYVSMSPGYPVDRGTTTGTLTTRVQAAKSDPTFESSGWLATESSLSMLGGEVTLSDWNKGAINHVIGLGLPDALRSPATHVWPAQRNDAMGTGTIPEGTHLRLPASYPVDPKLPKLIRMMIVAAKKYGFVVWGRGGLVGVRFELPQTGNPWSCPTTPCTNTWLLPGGAFYDNAGKFVQPYQMPGLFPWKSLQVVTKPAGTKDLLPPTLAQPANVTVKAGQKVSVPLSASSPGGYPVTFAAGGTPTLGSAVATATGLSYTAVTPGTETLKVHATDGSLWSPQRTFTVTVTP
jgi:hypothetical protein